MIGNTAFMFSFRDLKRATAGFMESLLWSNWNAYPTERDNRKKAFAYWCGWGRIGFFWTAG